MNQFESLCLLAAKEKWCWNLNCTTCGYMHFRYAFMELAAGKSPEDTNWIIHGKKTGYSKRLGPIPMRYSEEQKEKILNICSEADIAAIANNCVYPDWLGYLGLVLDHMYTKSDSFKRMSTNWATQLRKMVSRDSDIYERLCEITKSDADPLNIGDLQRCEGQIMEDRYRITM